MDTTDQQAVTVAQEVLESVAQAITSQHGETWPFEIWEAWQSLAASPEPVPATNQAGEVEGLLKYDAPQGTGRFELLDPEPANHHSALYLVDPNGAMFNISCWNEEGVDNARGEWMRNTLNAALLSYATSQAVPDADWAGDWQGDTPSDRAADLARGRQAAMSHAGNKSFASWSTETLARQCRMQARDQLDPELSSFFAEVADRLAALATQPATSQEGEDGYKAHFERMQDMMRRYIEPITYVASFPADSTKHAREFEEPGPHDSSTNSESKRRRMDRAFISDMIHMMDGPEQRALAATPTPPTLSEDFVWPEEAEFNAQTEAERLATLRDYYAFKRAALAQVKAS